MALKQIPPRDVSGRIKISESLINREIVDRSIKYLGHVKLEIEEYIKDPENQRRLGIELVDPNETVEEEKIYCLSNQERSEETY